MSNLYMLPFQAVMEKTAAEGDAQAPNPYIQVLLSGDPQKLASIFSDEDRAFMHLGENTLMKFAAGIPLSETDVQALGDTEVAALTVLGKDAMAKTAAYVEFLQQVSDYETSGRVMARTMYAKYAADAEAAEAQRVEQALQDPGTRQKLAHAASQLLAERRQQRQQQA